MIVKVVACRGVSVSQCPYRLVGYRQVRSLRSYRRDSDDYAIDRDGGRRWTVRGQSADNLGDIGSGKWSSSTRRSSDIGSNSAANGSGSRCTGRKSDDGGDG